VQRARCVFLVTEANVARRGCPWEDALLVRKRRVRDMFGMLGDGAML